MKRKVVLLAASAPLNQRRWRNREVLLRQALTLLVPRRRFVQVTHAVTGAPVCRVYFHRSGGHLHGRDVHNAANAKVDSSMETKLWHDADRTRRVDADFKFSDAAEQWTEVFADVRLSFRNWSCVQTLMEHSGFALSVAWHPHNSTKLASGSVDCTVKIWDVETGQCLRTLRGHTEGVTSVAWHPCDSTKLASGADDDTAKIWDAETGDCLRTLTGHSKSMRSVAWRPGGTQLASGTSLWQDVPSSISIFGNDGG